MIFDAIGWAGVLSCLFAYALISVRRVEGDSVLYQLLNIAGSSFLKGGPDRLDKDREFISVFCQGNRTW